MVFNKDEITTSDLLPDDQSIHACFNIKQPLLYQGKMELIVLPPCSASSLLNFVRKISNYPEIAVAEVLTLDSSDIINLNLKKPLDLISILKTTDGVIVESQPGECFTPEDTQGIRMRLIR